MREYLYAMTMQEIGGQSAAAVCAAAFTKTLAKTTTKTV